MAGLNFNASHSEEVFLDILEKYPRCVKCFSQAQPTVTTLVGSSRGWTEWILSPGVSLGHIPIVGGAMRTTANIETGGGRKHPGFPRYLKFLAPLGYEDCLAHLAA